MPQADRTVPVGLHVPRLYERLREQELKVAPTPDPRLYARSSAVSCR